MKDVIVARALHVLAVVIRIGGVSTATTVALTAVRRCDLGEDRMRASQPIEHRFDWEARVAVILVSLTGGDSRSACFWRMHAMVCLWLLFALFYSLLSPSSDDGAAERPQTVFAWLHRDRWLLMIISVVTILGRSWGARNGRYSETEYPHEDHNIWRCITHDPVKSLIWGRSVPV
jgi:hypothetical protein